MPTPSPRRRKSGEIPARAGAVSLRQLHALRIKGLDSHPLDSPLCAPPPRCWRSRSNGIPLRCRRSVCQRLVLTPSLALRRRAEPPARASRIRPARRGFSRRVVVARIVPLASSPRAFGGEHAPLEPPRRHPLPANQHERDGRRRRRRRGRRGRRVDDAATDGRGGSAPSPSRRRRRRRRGGRGAFRGLDRDRVRVLVPRDRRAVVRVGHRGHVGGSDESHGPRDERDGLVRAGRVPAGPRRQHVARGRLGRLRLGGAQPRGPARE